MNLFKKEGAPDCLAQAGCPCGVGVGWCFCVNDGDLCHGF